MELYVEILASTIRYTVPLILACIAGLWSERSGIVDIGLEGKMLIAAFVGAAFETIDHDGIREALVAFAGNWLATHKGAR